MCVWVCVRALYSRKGRQLGIDYHSVFAYVSTLNLCGLIRLNHTECFMWLPAMDRTISEPKTHNALLSFQLLIVLSRHHSPHLSLDFNSKHLNVL